MTMGITDLSNTYEEEFSIVIHLNDTERTAENLQHFAMRLAEKDKIHSFGLALEPNGVLVLKAVVPK